MDFEFNDDQRMMQSVAERLVADRYAPGERARYRARDCGYATENWAVLAESGLLALPFSADDGGMDGGAAEISAILGPFGRGLVAEPYLEEILIAGQLLAAAGDDTIRSTWLAGLIEGERHVGFALAEHQARYTTSATRTEFRDGALHGHKLLASGPVDAWVVSTQSGLALVEAGAEGLRKRDYRLIDGSIACELFFVGTPATALQPCDIDAALDPARIGMCAELTGIMDYLLETTLAYVKQRRQFGAPIGSFQAIQHRLADQYAQKELASSQLLRAMLAPEAERAAAIAAARAFIGDAALKLAEECVQLHGGMGISEELDIGTGLKRILLLTTLFGDAQHEIERYNRLLAA